MELMTDIVLDTALAIERADREKAPDYDHYDHPEVSDWGVHLALAALTTAATRLTDDRIESLSKRVAELEEAGRLALKVAESWIHDQLDGTSSLDNALAELDPARKILGRL